MKNYLIDRERYLLNYADSVYTEFMAKRFGIAGCKHSPDADLAVMRKELVDWQINEDGGALTTTSISYITWLGVNYDLEDIDMTSTGVGYLQSPTPVGPTNLSLNYNYGNGQSENIIEVNTGGCITRINLNPSIQITNNNSIGSYTYVQEVPATVWTIGHGLGFSPNVFIQDTNGIDIEGIVDHVNNNTLTVTFSGPVAGTAYLS